MRLVAEACSNHGGSRERALALVDAAAEAGFEVVKFQRFRVRELFAPEALRAHPELLEREAWELPPGLDAELAARAHARGLAYASTPFSRAALEEVAPHVDLLKVASYQLLDLELLRAVGAARKPVLVSTGLATLDEVRAAVDALREGGAADLELLHCVSSYPTPAEEANLAAIGTLRGAFGLPAGWSDHTRDADVVARAVRRHGAVTVELHLDLDGAGVEFPAGHCWLPREVRGLRDRLVDDAGQPPSHPADGEGRKAPRPCELDEVGWRADPSDGLRPLAAVRARLAAPSTR